MKSSPRALDMTDGLGYEHDPITMKTHAESQSEALLRGSPTFLSEAATVLHRAPRPAAQPSRSAAEVAQRRGGFSALLLASLPGSSPQARVMDTMILGLLAPGATAGSIVRWNAGGLVLLSCERARALPADARDGATARLSEFAGGYVADAARAASTVSP